MERAMGPHGRSPTGGGAPAAPHAADTAVAITAPRPSIPWDELGMAGTPLRTLHYGATQEAEIEGITAWWPSEDGRSQRYRAYREAQDTHWRSGTPAHARPMAGRERIDEHPDATIVVLRSEEAALRIESALGTDPRWIATTWMGPRRADASVDWGVLMHRTVWIERKSAEPADSPQIEIITRLVGGAGARSIATVAKAPREAARGTAWLESATPAAVPAEWLDQGPHDAQGRTSTGKTTQGEPNAAQGLERVLRPHVRALFRSRGGAEGHQSWIQVEDEGATHTWPLHGEEVLHWMMRRGYEETGRIHTPQITQALRMLWQARAAVGPLGSVARERWIDPESGALYWDLHDAEQRAVRITGKGWEVVRWPSAACRYAPGRAALPVPERGGRIEILREMMRIESETAWQMIQAWLVQALRPSGPYQHLALTGRHGTAKSTLARYLRELVDPVGLGIGVDKLPRNDEDLMLVASTARVVVIDNVSRLNPTWSDTLCTLATGTRLQRRRLYHDGMTLSIEACTPVITTSIAQVATRGDLRDRTVHVRLEPMKAPHRRTLTDLDERFRAIRAPLLGALCDALARALANLGRGTAPLRRMADAWDWVESAVEGDAWQRHEGIEKLRAACDESERESLADEIDASSVGGRILEWMKSHPKGGEGTATRWHERLREIRGGADFPPTPHHLSAELERIAPALLVEFGIAVRRSRRGKHGRRVTTIEPANENRQLSLEF